MVFLAVILLSQQLGLLNIFSYFVNGKCFFLGVYTNFLKFQHVLKLVVTPLLTQSLSQSVC